MKWITHWAVVALGLATVSTMFLTGPLISLTHDRVYHLEGAAGSLFVPVILNFCLLWLALAVAFRLAATHLRVRRVLWCAVLWSLPFLLLRNWSSLAEMKLPQGAIGGAMLLPVLAGAVLAVLRRGRLKASFDQALDFGATLLGFFSLLGVLVLVQLFWFGWQARNLNAGGALHHPSAIALNRSTHPRVIWILLDELSYREVYEQRFPGLQLPAFDALAATVTVFTQVVPAGSQTDRVVPALLTGLPVDRQSVDAAGGQLRLHDAATGAWNAFDPHATVFQDALNAGARTGVAGWYIPYCRILPEVLDRCSWRHHSPYPGHIVQGSSLWANVASPVQGFAASLWRSLFARPGPPSFNIDRSKMHLEDYRELYVESDSLLRDASIDFTFVHLPIPHPGGIFNRRRGELTSASSSYIDNLALTDAYLAHVRELLERSGQWDGSAVVVMGDHSWRTQLWAHTADWNREDEAASRGGQFDPRPAYVVKLSGQHEGTRIDATFEAIRTRKLMDELIANRLKTVGDLRGWVGR